MIRYYLGEAQSHYVEPRSTAAQTIPKMHLEYVKAAIEEALAA